MILHLLLNCCPLVQPATRVGFVKKVADLAETGTGAQRGLDVHSLGPFPFHREDVPLCLALLAVWRSGRCPSPGPPGSARLPLKGGRLARDEVLLVGDNEHLAVGDWPDGEVREVLRGGVGGGARIGEALRAKVAEGPALEGEPVAANLHLHAALEDEGEEAGRPAGGEELVAGAAAAAAGSLPDGDGLYQHLPQELLEDVA